MKSKFKIELFEEHSLVNYYTIRFAGEESEIEKFFDKFPEGCDYDEDIDIIIKWIDKIGERGGLERYFRPEGKQKDDVWAIPIETANLRLYLIRVTENIVILGNGGVKTTRTYNEDIELSSYVELLQTVNRFMNSRIRAGKLQVYQKQLIGNLNFYLKKGDEEK